MDITTTMKQTWRDRLKQALDASEKSMKAASIEAGKGETFIRDALKRNRTPSSENLNAIAKVLNVSSQWIIDGAGGDQFPIVDADYIRIPLVGYVQAGAWKSNDQWDWDDAMLYHLPKPGDHGNYFALEVRGDSMNLEYPVGSFLVCVPVADYNHELQSGDHVVVQRHENGQFEYTVKVLTLDEDGGLWLEPRSTNRHYHPMPFPEDPANDDGGVPPVMISAVVVADFRNHSRR